jgi:hypothetical protein
MAIKIFKCFPDFHSLNVFIILVMIFARCLAPRAFYCCYASCTRNVDMLYIKLLIPFEIKLYIFVTINIHTMERSVA